MNTFKVLFNKAKELYINVKTANVKVGSLLFYEVIIAISLLPIVMVVFLIMYMMAFGINSDWHFKLIDYFIKIINAVLSAQVMTCVIAYGAKLVDKDNNGIPDDLEK